MKQLDKYFGDSAPSIGSMVKKWLTEFHCGRTGTGDVELSRRPKKSFHTRSRQWNQRNDMGWLEILSAWDSWGCRHLYWVVTLHSARLLEHEKSVCAIAAQPYGDKEVFGNIEANPYRFFTSVMVGLLHVPVVRVVRTSATLS